MTRIFFFISSDLLTLSVDGVFRIWSRENPGRHCPFSVTQKCILKDAIAELGMDLNETRLDYLSTCVVPFLCDVPTI